MIKIQTLEQNDKIVELLEEARGLEIHLSQTANQSIAVTEINEDGTPRPSMVVDVMGGIS